MKKVITGHAYGVHVVVDLVLEVEVDEEVWDEMTKEEQKDYLVAHGRQEVESIEGSVDEIHEFYETYL